MGHDSPSRTDGPDSVNNALRDQIRQLKIKIANEIVENDRLIDENQRLRDLLVDKALELAAKR